MQMGQFLGVKASEVTRKSTQVTSVAMVEAIRTLMDDGNAHEGIFENINMETFAYALVKPIYPGRMSSENSKALSLKEDYLCGMTAFYEYIVHGTAPEEESLAIASQRASTFVDCAPKALIFEPNIWKRLRALKPRYCEVPRTKPRLPSPKRPTKPTHADKKNMVLEESAFWQKAGRFMKELTRAGSGWSVGKDGKLTMPCSTMKSKAMSFEDGAEGKQPQRSADFDF
jgi:hypothetical protein